MLFLFSKGLAIALFAPTLVHKQDTSALTHVQFWTYGYPPHFSKSTLIVRQNNDSFFWGGEERGVIRFLFGSVAFIDKFPPFDATSIIFSIEILFAKS